jgi:hypothetical protein
VKPRAVGWAAIADTSRTAMRWNGQHALPSPLISPAAHHMRLQLDEAEAERKAGSVALTQAEAELSRVLALRKQGWSTAAILERQQAVTEEARGRFARAERAVALDVVTATS